MWGLGHHVLVGGRKGETADLRIGPANRKTKRKLELFEDEATLISDELFEALLEGRLPLVCVENNYHVERQRQANIFAADLKLMNSLQTRLNEQAKQQTEIIQNVVRVGWASYPKVRTKLI
jgi:hypothetical protein